MTPQDFAAALITLGEECTALGGRPPATDEAAAALLACHTRLAPEETWRTFSDLAPDGAPLELVERFGGDEVLGLTLEPRHYVEGRSEHERFLTASMFAARIWPDVPDLLKALSASLRNRLWIGFDGESREIYLPVRRDTRPERVLASLGVVVHADTRSALADHAAGGRLVMLGLAVDAGHFGSATLYHRQERPRLPDALAFYPGLALGRSHWDDPNTGSAIRIRSDGVLETEAIYHYTSAYWRTDRALLDRVKEVLARLDLPSGTMPLLAGLIGISGRALQRRMIALSARPHGRRPVFKLYQSAAPYVRHHRQRAAREHWQGTAPIGSARSSAPLWRHQC